MWHYTGDVNIEHGGMFYFEDGPGLSPDYMRVVKVTPASDAGGPDNVFMVERGNIYMPNDDLKRMRSAADVCGYELTDDRSLIVGDDTHTFQSPEWRLCMLDAWNAYHGLDDRDEYVVRVGGVDRLSGSATGWLTNQEPDFITRTKNLKKWVEREFCN